MEKETFNRILELSGLPILESKTSKEKHRLRRQEETMEKEKGLYGNEEDYRLYSGLNKIIDKHVNKGTWYNHLKVKPLERGFMEKELFNRTLKRHRSLIGLSGMYDHYSNTIYVKRYQKTNETFFATFLHELIHYLQNKESIKNRVQKEKESEALANEIIYGDKWKDNTGPMRAWIGRGTEDYFGDDMKKTDKGMIHSYTWEQARKSSAKFREKYARLFDELESFIITNI